MNLFVFVRAFRGQLRFLGFSKLAKDSNQDPVIPAQAGIQTIN
jgi:hypothetical protein